MTRSMIKNHLDCYASELMPVVHQYESLFEAFEERFKRIEEVMAGFLFKGYLAFSHTASKLDFLNER